MSWRGGVMCRCAPDFSGWGSRVVGRAVRADGRVEQAAIPSLGPPEAPNGWPGPWRGGGYIQWKINRLAGPAVGVFLSPKRDPNGKTMFFNDLAISTKGGLSDR